MDRVWHTLAGVLNAGARPETPTDLLFFVTNRCDARCGHCFYRYAIDASDGSEELDLGRIELVARSLVAPLHSLVLTGGEPFLRSDLADICDLFARINRARLIVLPTNGLLPNRIVAQVREICERLDAGPVRPDLYLQVSLDGLPETHDAMRGIRGSFERAVATARGLAELRDGRENLYVTLSTTLSRRNLGEMEPLAEFVRDDLSLPQSFDVMRGTSFAGYTALSPQIASPASPSDDDQVLSLVELQDLYGRLKRLFRDNTDLACGHPLWTPLAYGYRVRRFWHLNDTLRRRRPFRCPAGTGTGVIYPSGEVALCELTKPVGNLADVGFDFRAVWTSAAAQTMRAAVRRCFCTHGCFQTVAMMREPRMFPLIATSALHYLVRRV